MGHKRSSLKFYICYKTGFMYPPTYNAHAFQKFQNRATGIEGAAAPFPLQRPYSWCRGHCFPLLEREPCKEAARCSCWGAWPWGCPMAKRFWVGYEPAFLLSQGCTLWPLASYQTSLKWGTSVVKRGLCHSLLGRAAVGIQWDNALRVPIRACT